MSRLLPIIATPTPDSREAFMRAIWDADMGWCSSHAPATQNQREGEIEGIRANLNYTYVYLMDTSHLRAVIFAEHESEANMLIGQTHTLVNSPRHFVAYARRLRS